MLSRSKHEVRFLLLAFLLYAAHAHAQSAPRVWDIALGTHVSALPATEFIDPACGSNGGPAGAPLASFADFAQCTAEASGLREVWFIYDDTQEYVAFALRNPVLMARYRTTAINQHPVILSFLVDAEGRVAGYRIFTDPRAEEALRYDAHILSANLRARFGTAWTCRDIAATPGETPVAGQGFVKQTCVHEGAGLRATVDSRFFYKPGQTMIAAEGGQPMVNAFESRAWLEVRATGPLPPAAPVAATAPDARTFASPREAFLAGAAKDCPGCELVDADLRKRDLAGANLAGANLEGAVLHRADLRRANLSGANLGGANLNRADLTFANLSGAKLREAMLWQADASRADFSGADIAFALLGKARLALANLRGANLTRTDLGEARVNDANLNGATLNESFLYLTTLIRADLRNATIERAVIGEASLRDANLTGASLRESDLLAADLSGANLTNADFSGTRLMNANLTAAITAGTKFTGALMPDNTVRP
jgi:uncharacterized protein YjbI with pentapeptide repeats